MGQSQGAKESGERRTGFVEAVSVFNDPLARIFADVDHPIGQLREIVIASEGARSHHQRPARYEKRATRL
jgi:hypothetical protein